VVLDTLGRGGGADPARIAEAVAGVVIF